MPNVWVSVEQQGNPLRTVPLEYGGVASTFRSELRLAGVGLQPGNFELVLFAERPTEGNAGTDRMVLTFRR